MRLIVYTLMSIQRKILRKRVKENARCRHALLPWEINFNQFKNDGTGIFLRDPMRESGLDWFSCRVWFP